MIELILESDVLVSGMKDRIGCNSIQLLHRPISYAWYFIRVYDRGVWKC